VKPAWTCLPPALLAAFVGTIAALLPAPAHAATPHEWNDVVTLRLADGRAIGGRYRGMLGWPTDPSTYADRYEAWRQQIGTDAAPALGETLRVTCRTGARVSGPFRGLAGQALLLGSDDSCADLVVPLEQVQEAHRALEPGIDLGWAARNTWPEGPSTYATAIWVDGRTLTVPVVEAASTPPPAAQAGSAAGGTAGAAILGVLVGGAIVYFTLVYSIRHAFDSAAHAFGSSLR
jgi:hypothetical protein